MATTTARKAPRTNFLVGLGTTHKVSVKNPVNTSFAPVLRANPVAAPTISIRANHFVRIVLEGNKRESVILVGAAPSGLVFQRTLTVKPGQTVVLQASPLKEKFRAARG